jgi:hypothetical protein
MLTHKNVSFAKSDIRIEASILTVRFNSLGILAIGYGVAELLGIAEEVYDKREEV